MIRITDLALAYRAPGAEHQAVRGVTLEVSDGQFYTLLGPSGCGKTTTLRCVAGLERPDRGEIVIDDRVVSASGSGTWIPPHERGIGMVFQSYAIWPHMSVFDTVAFPLRYSRPRPGRTELHDRVMRALAAVQLQGLERRPAPALSGGQQQRLALARALVAEPRVLLLDEPLSNLDAKLRDEMRVELRDLVKRLGVTTLFVTHEQIEALTMSDVIGVMNGGVLVQQGTPAEIYGSPNGSFVAEFVGRTNFIPATVVATAEVGTPLGRLACTVPAPLAEGMTARVAIRPENVELVRDGSGAAGEVVSALYLGNLVDCSVRVGELVLRVQLHPSSAPRAGDRVGVRIAGEHCRVLTS